MTDKQPIRTTPPKGAKCCATVYSRAMNFPRGKTCNRPGKHQSPLNPAYWYCGIHNPAKSDKRADARRNAIRAELMRARRDAARLALYPKLVEAVQEIIDTGHPDVDKCLDLLAEAAKIEGDSR